MQELVEIECNKWIEKGVNVRYENRSSRQGYKAGALKEGLEKQYVKDCEFVAIFDADFQPDDDFLLKTIPYMIANPDLGLVQARWKFGKTIPVKKVIIIRVINLLSQIELPAKWIYNLTHL